MKTKTQALLGIALVLALTVVANTQDAPVREAFIAPNGESFTYSLQTIEVDIYNAYRRGRIVSTEASIAAQIKTYREASLLMHQVREDLTETRSTLYQTRKLVDLYLMRTKDLITTGTP